MPSPDTEVVGYYSKYGPTSGNYTNKVDVGNVTNATLYGLVEGATYFFVVTAYNDWGLESDPSNEVSYTVPSSTNIPTVALTSPTNGTICTAPATVNLAVNVATNGHALTKVQYYNGTVLLGESGAAPYSLAWTNMNAGTYSLSALAVFDGGSLLAPSPTNVVMISPASIMVAMNVPGWNWSTGGVGQAWYPQTAVTHDGTSALQSGVIGAWQTNWIETSVVGPGTLSFWWKVSSETNYDFLRFYVGGVEVGRISGETGWGQTNFSIGTGTQTLRWAYTKDGYTTMGQDAGWVDQVSFVSNVTATVITDVASLPAPWQTADIGNVGLAGSASVSNDLYTVSGSGTISGTTDNFRIVYQPLSGDGEITVRINSVQNTSASGCIGVIIRESLLSGSEYAFMGISPDGTFRWQLRSQTGGLTSSTTASIVTPPNSWVRLVRMGDTFSGFGSSDGTTWTQLSSNNITMASSIYIGLAVASGSSNTLNTATFTITTVVP